MALGYYFDPSLNTEFDGVDHQQHGAEIEQSLRAKARAAAESQLEGDEVGEEASWFEFVDMDKV
jgi:hypothetical protein